MERTQNIVIKIGNRANCAYLCLFVAGLMSACVQSTARIPAVSTSASLAGTWRVLEYVAWDSAGSPQNAFGPEPSGYVTFSQTGIAFIQIMKPDDVASFAAYYGPFSVNPSADSLSVRVEGTNIPSYLRTVQRRPFQIRNDTLVLGVTGQYRATLVRVR